MCGSKNPSLKPGRQCHAQISALSEPDLLEAADHQQRFGHQFQLEGGDDARDGIDCAGAVIAGLDDQRVGFTVDFVEAGRIRAVEEILERPRSCSRSFQGLRK